MAREKLTSTQVVPTRVNYWRGSGIVGAAGSEDINIIMRPNLTSVYGYTGLSYDLRTVLWGSDQTYTDTPNVLSQVNFTGVIDYEADQDYPGWPLEISAMMYDVSDTSTQAFTESNRVTETTWGSATFHVGLPRQEYEIGNGMPAAWVNFPLTPEMEPTNHWRVVGQAMPGDARGDFTQATPGGAWALAIELDAGKIMSCVHHENSGGFLFLRFREQPADRALQVDKDDNHHDDEIFDQGGVHTITSHTMTFHTVPFHTGHDADVKRGRAVHDGQTGEPINSMDAVEDGYKGGMYVLDENRDDIDEPNRYVSSPDEGVANDLANSTENN